MLGRSARGVLLSGLLPLIAAGVATNVFLADRAFHLAASIYDQQRLVQVAALLGVAVLSVLRRREVTATWSTLPLASRLALGLLALLGSLSAATAPLPRLALREVGLFALLAMAAFVVADARRRVGAEFDRHAIAVIAGSALAYVTAFAALDALGKLGLGTRGAGTMWGFDNPRFFGQVGLWVMPLLVSATSLRRHTTRTRVILFVLSTWWGALVLESGSRAALVGLAAGSAAAALSIRTRAGNWLLTAAAVIPTSWFAWVLLYGRSGMYGRSGSSSAAARLVEESVRTTDRFGFWRDALDLLARDVLLGIGPEHYAHTRGTLYAHPHSAYVQFASEWGVPAAVIAVGLALGAGWTWCRRSRSYHSDPNVRAGLTAAVAAGGVAALADGLIVTPVSQLMLASVVGWMVGISRQSVVLSTPPTALRQRFWLPALAVSAMAALVAGVLPYALAPGHAVREFQRSSPEEVISPRFWLIGRTAPGGLRGSSPQPIGAGGQSQQADDATEPGP